MSEEEPDYAAMPSHNLLDVLGDDGFKWATAFCQVKNAQGWGADDIDHGLMLAWFCNTIETSWAARVEKSGVRPPDNARISAEAKVARLHRALMKLLESHKHLVRDTNSEPSFGEPESVTAAEKTLFENRPHADYERC